MAAQVERRLRSLSSRERLLLLLGFSAVILFLLVRLVAYPAADRYRKARAEIPLRRATLARYEAVGKGQDEAASRLSEAEGRLKEWEQGLLPGNDPSASGAVLQGILKPRVERPDTRLTSIRSLSPAAKGAYAEVAVQVDLQTSTEGLAALLGEIAREPKLLRVKKLTVNSGAFSAAWTNRPDTLTVSIVVAGLTAAPAESRPGAGGVE